MFNVPTDIRQVINMINGLWTRTHYPFVPYIY